MKVTRVKIFEGKGRVLANMNITIDDCLAINGIRVVLGTKGIFISFPQTSYTDKDGTTQYRYIAFPCTKESREELNKVLMKKYEEWKSSGKTFFSE